MNDNTRFYYRQGWQLLGFIVLIVGVSLLADWERLAQVSFLGLSGATWMIISLAAGPLHQFYIWYMWRSELYNQRITPMFNGRGFEAFMVGFFFFMFLRVATLVIVAAIDAGSLPLHWSLRWGVGTVMFAVSAYALYSVFRYFGVRRAAGADHFDAKYRTMPFENRGIYRYTSNAMYIYALLILWVVGIWTQSSAGLLLAFYFHAAVWLHYYCTEKPDLQVIHG